MCLAVPGKIISIDRSVSEVIMAEVSFGGVIKQVCLELLPDAKTGDYVMVHVGYAISQVDEKEALETLRIVMEAEKKLVKKLSKGSKRTGAERGMKKKIK
ncbi:MAG: HypC/HybG/HupF family hydrogenase formation chaperone [Bacillota bacterium]